MTYNLMAGAAGIVFPHIDTPEEAAEAVYRCKYASTGGHRSLSPSALLSGVTDIAPGSSHEQVADKHIAVICQIESSVRIFFILCRFFLASGLMNFFCQL